MSLLPWKVGARLPFKRPALIASCAINRTSTGLLALSHLCFKLTARTYVQARVFPKEGFALLPIYEKFEEERFSLYQARSYYPVRLGEIFKSRYQAVAKLGYGTASTVWLCRDLRKDVLMTLKVCVLGNNQNAEVAISHHIAAIDDELHPGKDRLRIATDNFHVQSAGGNHQCLVFPPLGMTLANLRDLFEERALEKNLLQFCLFMVTLGLDFLHQAGIVHTDLSPNNILMGASNDIISRVEEAEINTPSPRKILPDRVIHLSYAMPTSWGSPVITDFGAARLGDPGQMHDGDVMPGMYRAPEIIAGRSWDSKIDIWSFGVMIWDLFEGGNLFQTMRGDNLDDELHFAEMVSLMGPPPKKFLENNEKCRKFWDAEGNWIASTPIPDQTLESRETRLAGHDKELLLMLMRKILRWLPEERPSAQDLYEDGFIKQWEQGQA